MGTGLGAYELNHKCTSIMRARRLEEKDVLTVKCFPRKKIGNLLFFLTLFLITLYIQPMLNAAYRLFTINLAIAIRQNRRQKSLTFGALTVLLEGLCWLGYL